MKMQKNSYRIQKDGSLLGIYQLDLDQLKLANN